MSTIADSLHTYELIREEELMVGRPLVARLEGRQFERMFEHGQYQIPYDVRFGKVLVKTAGHLVTALGAAFGFVERSEMSLYALASGGNARRLLSRISGEAGSKLSLLLGHIATFDVHLYQFPDRDLVFEYFRWRQQSTLETAVDRYCRSILIKSGSASPTVLDGLGHEEKIEFLRQNSLELQEVPAWQRMGAYVQLRSEAGADAAPGGQDLVARLIVDLHPPGEEQFHDYLRRLLSA